VENLLHLSSTEFPTKEAPREAAMTATARAVAASFTEGASEGTEGGRAARRSRASVAKVTVNLPEEMAAALRELAEQEGKTFTQALKEAISLKLFVADVVEQGGKLLVEYPDKTVERILFGVEPRGRRPR
jgi:hypothetical protein